MDIFDVLDSFCNGIVPAVGALEVELCNGGQIAVVIPIRDDTRVYLYTVSETASGEQWSLNAVMMGKSRLGIADGGPTTTCLGGPPAVSFDGTCFSQAEREFPILSCVDTDASVPDSVSDAPALATDGASADSE